MPTKNNEQAFEAVEDLQHVTGGNGTSGAGWREVPGTLDFNRPGPVHPVPEGPGIAGTVSYPPPGK